MEPTSLGIEWTKWISCFDNLLQALATTADKRQRALLLFYAGSDVHNIYNTLVCPTDEITYAQAKDKLAPFFESVKNETFEVYNFRPLEEVVENAME